MHLWLRFLLQPSVSAAVRPTLYVLLTEGGDMLQTMCAAGEDSGKVFDEASVETLYLKQSGKTREQFLKVGSLLPPSLPFLATKTLTQHTISTSLAHQRFVSAGHAAGIPANRARSGYRHTRGTPQTHPRSYFFAQLAPRMLVAL